VNGVVVKSSRLELIVFFFFEKKNILFLFF
jgi:hypothetical protein